MVESEMWFYLFIGILLILMFLNFVLYDLIIRLQYHEYKKSWISDGKPIGMFFVPKESSIIFGTFAKNRQMRKLLFQTPSWMEYDKNAKRLLAYYRFFVIVTILVLLSPLLFYLSR